MPASCSGDEVLSALRRGDHYPLDPAIPQPAPFADMDERAIYAFFRAHVRPAPHVRARRHLTSFTFLVVGASELAAAPPQIGVCSDAPDLDSDVGEWDDGAPPSDNSDERDALKLLTLPLDAAARHLHALEWLKCTLVEIAQRRDTYISLQPPPWLVPAEDAPRPDLLRLATPAEARDKKRRGVRRYLAWEREEEGQAEEETSTA